MDLNELTPILIALAGSAGLWGFLSQRSKHAYEQQAASDVRNAEFNETLKDQVTRLTEKVDKLVVEKEELLNAIADLRAELAEARTTVQHLEAVVRLRGSYREE